MKTVFTPNEQKVLKLIYKFNGNNKKIYDHLKEQGESEQSFKSTKHYLFKRMRVDSLLEAILEKPEGKQAFKKVVEDFVSEVESENDFRWDE